MDSPVAPPEYDVELLSVCVVCTMQMYIYFGTHMYHVIVHSCPQKGNHHMCTNDNQHKSYIIKSVNTNYRLLLLGAPYNNVLWI